jgi:hypothetical protein
VAWAVVKLKSLGFQNVHSEPVRVPHWIRGEARAEIASPWPQSLMVTALGGSVATPPEGIEAEVIAVRSLEELAKTPREQVAGKIVYFGGRMERTSDLSGYRGAVPVRSRGPSETGKLGAVAAVIRTVGTSPERFPHTGALRYDSKAPRIAGLALSIPTPTSWSARSPRASRSHRLLNTSVWAESTMSARTSSASSRSKVAQRDRAVRRAPTRGISAPELTTTALSVAIVTAAARSPPR